MFVPRNRPRYHCVWWIPEPLRRAGTRFRSLLRIIINYKDPAQDIFFGTRPRPAFRFNVKMPLPHPAYQKKCSYQILAGLPDTPFSEESEPPGEEK